MTQPKKHKSRSCRIDPGLGWAWEHLVPDDTNADTSVPTSDDDDGDGTPPPGSARLGALFHGLPRDLRDAVFAQLLVRPAKWDVAHAAGCEKRRLVPPHENIRPGRGRRERAGWVCATRMRGNVDLATQLAAGRVWRDPWASRWAPAPTNEWVCTLCWNARLRPRPFPEPWSLPCLCARRAELQVLLVCRQWYAEAGAVLYQGNTFAFAHPGECVDFLTTLAPRWAPLISKVSLRALPADDRVAGSPAEALALAADVPADGECGLARAWALLGATLPGLAELELDAVFLTRPETVAVLRRPGLAGRLRCVRFTQSRPLDWQCRIVHRDPRDWRYGVLIPRDMHGNVHLPEVQAYVWSSEHRRRPVDDSDVATDVARAIRGLAQHGCDDEQRDDAREAVQEQKRYLARFCPTVAEVVPCGGGA